MQDIVAAIVCIVFTALALWHIHMALQPLSGRSTAVPSVSGKPLFTPSRKATVAVALVLLSFVGLVAATAGVVATGLPPRALSVVVICAIPWIAGSCRWGLQVRWVLQARAWQQVRHS